MALYFLICEMGILTLALANLQGWCGNQVRKHRGGLGRRKAQANKGSRSLLLLP